MKADQKAKKMFWKVWISVIILMSFGVLSAQPGGFQRGNEWMERGEVDLALKEYEALLDQGKESYGLFYNLGNAYAKKEETGRAILFYERARAIEVTPEVDQNLKRMESRISNDIPEFSEFFLLRYWHGFIRLLSPNAWALVTLIMGGVFLFLLWKFVMRQGDLRWVILALTGSVLGLMLAWSSLRLDKKTVYAIVVSDARLFEASDKRSEEIRKISEGVKVGVLKELSGWKKVILPDKEVGWMADEALEVI